MKKCNTFLVSIFANLITGRKRFTTAVVLVTRQAVIGTATEIDTLPKDQFRARSRVILGHNCSGPPIQVRDYTNHPEFRRHSYTALALIQLDVDNVAQALSKLQRFGQCDSEEKQLELYSDSTNITGGLLQRMRLNITLYANVEYSCVIFKLKQVGMQYKTRPYLRLRRWCAGARTMCSGFQLLQMDFYVEIFFERKIQFTMRAYGKRAEVIDSYRAMYYANMRRTKPDIDFIEDEIQELLAGSSFQWEQK